jgi:hypothetical protein
MLKRLCVSFCRENRLSVAVPNLAKGSVLKVLLVFLKALLSKAFKNTNNMSRT